MSWFTDLRIRAKLLVGFGAVLALTAVLGGVAFVNLNRLAGDTQEIAANWLPSVETVSDINTMTSDYRIMQLDHVLADDLAQMDAIERQLDSIARRVEAQRRVYEPLISSDEERQLYDRFVQQWSRYVEANAALVALSRQMKTAEATALLRGDAQRQFLESSDVATRLVALNHDGAVEARDRASARSTKARATVIGSILLAIVLGGTFAAYLARLIGAPMQRLADSARRLARGDVSQTVAVESRDELGELAGAFATVIDAQQALARGADALANGDLSLTPQVRSDVDVVGQSMLRLHGTLGQLVGETDRLAKAGREGRLSERGDAARFEGAYRALVAGINAMLDAVVHPVNEAAAVLRRLSERDLTGRVTGDYAGDHAQIKSALNTAIENLEQALREVGAASGQVASAGTQITSGSQSLASASSEQAAAIEEVASSLQEMSATSREASDNADRAREFALQSRTQVGDSVQRARELSVAIERMKRASDDTAKIVKTIDEIAFQTNLLALNAAVEAARAGDAGKGFAVVAEEVRALALRSAEAAKQTAALIEEVVTSAGGGVALNEGVMRSLGEVDAKSGALLELIGAIASGSEEQRRGVEQITTAVDQMSGVTQQVAANAEESAAAAEELSGQSRTLAALVDEFRLADDGARRPGAARPAPSAAPMPPRQAPARAGVKAAMDRLPAPAAKAPAAKTPAAKTPAAKAPAAKAPAAPPVARPVVRPAARPAARPSAPVAAPTEAAPGDLDALLSSF